MHNERGHQLDNFSLSWFHFRSHQQEDGVRAAAWARAVLGNNVGEASTMSVAFSSGAERQDGDGNCGLAWHTACGHGTVDINETVARTFNRHPVAHEHMSARQLGQVDGLKALSNRKLVTKAHFAKASKHAGLGNDAASRPTRVTVSQRFRLASLFFFSFVFMSSTAISGTDTNSRCASSLV